MAVLKPDGDTPMTSKKFLAYMVAELTWKGLMVLLILSTNKLGDNLILLTIVLIAGFLEVSYILGQAYVDRYMRIADNAFDKIKDTVDAVVPDNTPDPKKDNTP